MVLDYYEGREEPEPINDGGPAFPTSMRMQERYMDAGGTGRSRMVSVDADGMTLRDWFAGQALVGMLSYSMLNPSTGNYHENCHTIDAARSAYAYADAMLKARDEA